jgi:hypothetical protein
MQQEIAIDAVPGAVEADGQLLDYIERSVAIYSEKRIEVTDANATALRPRRTGERAEK